MDSSASSNFRVLLFGILLHLVTGTCSDTSLGMESGKIPDNKISASSKDSVNTPAKNGRLNYTTGQSWCASTQNSDQYLQIDLGTTYIICAVATQGNSQEDQWVKTYQLQTSTDGTWVDYEEEGQARVFKANSDRDRIVKHVLRKGIVAKLIRFLPKSYSGSMCLRAEVFGIKQQEENVALNKSATQKSTPASSKAAALAVNGIPDQCSATTASTNPWWEVDLGEIAVVFEVNILSQASSEEFKVQVGETLCQGTLKIPDGGPLSIVCSNRPIHNIIKISIQGHNKVLILCEVQVPKLIESAVNLALNKDAKQSSTRDKSNGCNDARCAVDGNRDNDFLGGKSCSHTAGATTDPWWRVDLGSVQPVSRVYVVNRKGQFGDSLSDFELRIGNNDSDVGNPKCGYNYSVPTAEALTIYCSPPMYGRYVYIRIPGQKKTIAMCEVEVYSDGNACRNQAIGTSNSSSFPDNSWTASSSETGNEPHKARLNGAGVWTPATNSSAGYLQIDLGAVYVICAVATQGNPNKNEWTKTYKIKVSVNKDDWKNYKEGNSDKVLTGNADKNSIVKYNLVGLHQARFVRFVPVEYNGRKALRVEIYGVLQGVLAPPTDLTIANIQSRSATVQWTNPDDDPALEIALRNEIHYSSGDTTKDITTQSLTTSQSVTGLTPYTEYKVKVLVVNNVGQGLWSAEKSFTTDSDVPEEAPNLKTVTALTSQSVSVTWQKPDKINGELVGYRVLYRKTEQGSFITEMLTGSATSHTLNSLEKETEYEVKVQVYNSKGDSPASDVKTVRTLEDAESSNSSSTFPVEAVAAPVVILLLIMLVLIGLLVWKRRTRNQRNRGVDRVSVQVLKATEDGANSVDAMSTQLFPEGIVAPEGVMAAEDVYSEADDGVPRPIPVLNFADYANRMKRNNGARLRAEFKLLKSDQTFPRTVGKKPENKSRNRYGNIVTYDHSRVALEIPDQANGNDYINASYMPGFNGDPKTYIATQGPTSKTVNDFWQVVWQEKSTSIVMLTNLVELNKAKCAQYWPDKAHVYGSVAISAQKQEMFADYMVRTFLLKKDGISRQVRQFHFTSWPDKGVPQYPTAVLTFRRKVRSWKPADSGPTVVHCSAGVGRTGTYIVIDAMMQQAKKQNTVDIFNYTQKLRTNRPNMVQTDEQYVFIHQAILEALTCGNTEISAEDLRIAMNKLSRASQGGGVNGYSQEFQRLKVVSYDLSEDERRAGREPENVAKNRFPLILPLDSSRVTLRTGGKEGYINASFVDAYRERNAFIMTQAPLDSTIEDFWHMALQYKTGTVVMLNNMQEKDMNTPQYWPSQGALTYGGITVETASEEQRGNICTRTLKVHEVKRPKHVLTVKQHQYSGWPDKTVPSNHEEVLDLMAAVQTSQQQSDNAPIIVHCSDGVGRSGTFCAIYSAVERLKLDQVVDVFQTIKLLRVKRPGAVETLDQYVFCYEAVQKYLDFFGEYSNFSNN